MKLRVQSEKKIVSVPDIALKKIKKSEQKIGLKIGKNRYTSHISLKSRDGAWYSDPVSKPGKKKKKWISAKYPVWKKKKKVKSGF